MQRWKTRDGMLSPWPETPQSARLTMLATPCDACAQVRPVLVEILSLPATDYGGSVPVYVCAACLTQATQLLTTGTAQEPTPCP